MFAHFHRSRTPHLVIDTVRRFKGLERPVVVLVGTRRLVNAEELAYLATSRPRLHLVMIGYAREIEELKTHTPSLS
jgi:hypothetical protein